jgi:hypothetical protein
MTRKEHDTETVPAAILRLADQLQAVRAALPPSPLTQALASIEVSERLMAAHEAQPPTRKTSIPDKVEPTTMLRLEAAAALAFPDSSMSVAALRREAAAGHLTIYRIAGKDFTTLANIEEMKTTCRVQARVQGSHCSKPEDATPSGTSATGSAPSARDALKATAQALKGNLPPTSTASTTRKPVAAAVIPIRSK